MFPQSLLPRLHDGDQGIRLTQAAQLTPFGGEQACLRTYLLVDLPQFLGTSLILGSQSRDLLFQCRALPLQFTLAPCRLLLAGQCLGLLARRLRCPCRSGQYAAWADVGINQIYATVGDEEFPDLCFMPRALST